MDDLIDIQGLDAISWWPLAKGWWFVIVLSSIILVVVAYFLYRRFKYRRSWQYDMYTNLDYIKQNISEVGARASLQELSTYLRIIAMRSADREKCAALVGSNWLDWLQANDPREYPWCKKGALLTNSTYMPNDVEIDISLLEELIMAAKGWVKQC